MREGEWGGVGGWGVVWHFLFERYSGERDSVACREISGLNIHVFYTCLNLLSH